MTNPIAIMAAFDAFQCYQIVNKKQLVDIRKSYPTTPDPFPYKVYMYCKHHHPDSALVLNSGELSLVSCGSWDAASTVAGKLCNGKVIGEYMCYNVRNIQILNNGYVMCCGNCGLEYSGKSTEEIVKYIGCGNTGYACYISEVKLYDKPKELWEFAKPCSHNCSSCKWYNPGSFYEPPGCEQEDYLISSPPRGWCYVDERALVI